MSHPVYIGNYSIHDLIGVGGMATVHLGRLRGAAGFSRTVAIKRMLPHCADELEFKTLFVREATLAARVQHVNVVGTLDAIGQDGELILVMDYVEGETLARLLSVAAQQEKTLPERVVLRIVVDALSGLQAVHGAQDSSGQPLGIVHRDVSPHNLMVGTDGVTRVMDFGIAKAASSVDATRTGVVRGKSSYISPEQLLRNPLTHRSDVYAMGVVLWEALTGERLFANGSRAEMLSKIAGDVESPRVHNPDLSESLEMVVTRAMSPQARDRYETASEMALAISSSCTLAAPREVASWVNDIASEALAKRHAAVARLESREISLPKSLPIPSVPRASVPRDERSSVSALAPKSWLDAWRWPWLPALAGALGVCSWILFLRDVNPLPRDAPDETLASAEASPARPRNPDRRTPHDRDEPHTATAHRHAPAARAQSQRPQSSRANADSSESERHEQSPTASGRQRRRAVRRAKSRRQREEARAPLASDRSNTNQSCKPPYTVDSQGHRHYKIECF